MNRPTLLLPALMLTHALAHLGLGWVLGLSGDEAHYALYATHPALSYFDHPPLVGWVQWPLVALDAPEGVLRLLPQALWLGTAAFVYALAQRLHSLLGLNLPERAAGTWAVLAFSLAPLLHVLAIGLLPDTLLMFFTAALMWQTVGMMRTPLRGRDWLVLGALLGLAGLSKYTAIFAALPVAACLLAAHGPALLRQRGPWLALALAVVLVLPVFVWNAEHGWISFAYQLHHGRGSHWQWRALLGFVLAQAVLYPLLAWSAVGLQRKTLGSPLARPWAWLLGFFGLPFAVLAYLSGGGSGLPHWTAPAWVALAPFAGLGLAALWQQGRRRAVWLLGGLQAFLTASLYGLMLTAGPTWLASTPSSTPSSTAGSASGRAPGSSPPGNATEAETLNPFTDFYGWREAGARARTLAAQHQVSHLAVQNWTLASRLAWYARPLPVHVLAPGFDQFSLWSGNLASGSDSLVLDWSQMAYHPPVGEGQFERCTLLETLPVQRAGRAVAHFSLSLCQGWGGRAAPRRQGE